MYWVQALAPCKNFKGGDIRSPSFQAEPRQTGFMLNNAYTHLPHAGTPDTHKKTPGRKTRGFLFKTTDYLCFFLANTSLAAAWAAAKRAIGTRKAEQET